MLDLSSDVETIWTIDREMQTDCLEKLSSQVRNVTDPDIIEKDVQMLKSLGAFFVPDDYYLTDLLGERITQFKYGIYRGSEMCTLAERLAVPLRRMNGTIFGFVGYSDKSVELSIDEDEETGATNMLEEEVSQRSKYLYPPKHVYEKAKYLYCEPSWFRSAIEKGYVAITDGLFDTIRLNQNGIPAVSICGSALSRWHVLYLSFIKNKIIIADNDNAGARLAGDCRKLMPECKQISFPNNKDIDDVLKTKEGIGALLATVKRMVDEHFILSYDLRGYSPTQVKQMEHAEAIVAQESEKFQRNVRSRNVAEQGSLVMQELQKLGKLYGYVEVK